MIVVEVFLEMAYSCTIPCRKVVIARNQLLTFVAVMYRLYHEVEVSMGFTHRGPKARGCVNHIETDTE